MNFKSDNIIGVHPSIMDAIVKANQGTETSYGNDAYSKKLAQKFSEVFETDVKVFLANTGTVANVLGLSALVKPYEIIHCHKEAHINTDEAGAPELFTSGARILTVGGGNGKIDLQELKQIYETITSLIPHGGKSGCISISQATECGTLYNLEELGKLSEFVKSKKLTLHMDGARFANSVATLKATPAELTWKSGIDAMSFGATKNGALAAEAILFFNKKYAEDFEYRHKRAGQLASKMRFFACQFLAYLENDLWLKNAQHANQMAQKLLRVFTKNELKERYPVEANELFIDVPKPMREYFTQKGVGFYGWGPADGDLCRFVTSCLTSEAELQAFEKCLGAYRGN